MLTSDAGRILHRFRILSALAIFVSVAQAKVVTEWDFSKGTLGWTGNAQVLKLRSSGEGLLVRSTGQDPWIEGPAVELPGNGPVDDPPPVVGGPVVV